MRRFKEDTAVTVAKMQPGDIEGYYQHERTEKNALKTALLQYHEIIKEALAYAVELELIRANPADQVNSITGEARILFTDFLLEWLEMMKHNVEMTTYASYTICIKSCVIPYFKEFKLTLKEVTPKHIQDYYRYELNEKGVSAYTVIHRHANIRKALQYAFKVGLIDFNPADRIERPKIGKFVASIYDANELEALFAVVKNKPLELAVILMFVNSTEIQNYFGEYLELDLLMERILSVDGFYFAWKYGNYAVPAFLRSGFYHFAVVYFAMMK